MIKTDFDIIKEKDYFAVVCLFFIYGAIMTFVAASEHSARIAQKEAFLLQQQAQQQTQGEKK